MPLVSLPVGSLSFEGKNLKAATTAALAFLAQLFPTPERGMDWAPIILGPYPMGGDHSKPVIGVVFKDAAGSWSYRIRFHDIGLGSCHSGGWTIQEATNRANRHLAQLAYFPGESESFTSTLAILDPADLEGRRDHAAWTRFQDAYALARADGANDTAAHAFAAELSSLPALEFYAKIRALQATPE